MGDKPEIYKVFLETIKYELMILHIPDNEVDDYLTYFSREKGLIRKSSYYDFLMSRCIANASDFINHLSNRKIDISQLNTMREEIIECILKHNPLFEPEKIVINRNGVVKVKSKSQKDTIALTKNDVWEEDTYKESEEIFLSKKEQNKKIKNIKDIPYKPVQKFWKRIQGYISVKQYDPSYMDAIINNKVFSTRGVFEQYVVAVCIENIDDLYTRLDHEGLSKLVAPPILIHELYQECRSVNPFLDFDIYSGDMEDDEDYQGVSDPFSNFHKRMKTNEDLNDEPMFNTKNKSKLFRNVNKEKLMGLSSALKKVVVGQDDAIDVVVSAIQRASVGLKDPEKPIGSFIFAGPSGVGKTLLCKHIAKELTGDIRNLITIDCSEYFADHEYSKLIGASHGYVGFEQGGILTNFVRKNPFCVVLFDEIEKANDKVYQLLLQVMDEGRLTDGKGQQALFKDVIVVMTSNLGVKELRDVSKTVGFGDVSMVDGGVRVKAVGDAMKRTFSVEFINRVTSIVTFNTLTYENYMKIIELELNKLKTNLKDNDTMYSCVSLVFDETLYGFVYKDGVDENYGARPLKRTIEKEVSTPLALKLLCSNVDEFTTVDLSVKEDKLLMDVKQSVAVNEPPFYMVASAGEIDE